jgi:hypothetical protein
VETVVAVFVVAVLLIFAAVLFAVVAAAVENVKDAVRSFKAATISKRT